MTSYDETTDTSAPLGEDDVEPDEQAAAEAPAADAPESPESPEPDATEVESEAPAVDPDVVAVLGATPAPAAADEPAAVDEDAAVAAFLAGGKDDDEAEADEVEADEPAAVDEAPVEAAAIEADGDGDGDAEGETDEAESEAPSEPVDNPYTRPGKWFVVHTQSGYEKKVQQNLLARTQSMNMEDSIYEVVIPMEDVAEFKQGKKVIVQKKVFPGYLLVRCNLTDDSWFVIRNTPGVTGFVGHGNKPSPLPRKDVMAFLQVKKEGDESAPKRTKPRYEFELNETVRVKEGPFADFSGEIVEINEDQLKVKVLVNIFGRETPVELEFSQVAKL
jgi:transcription termination/antitermination protein NusG